MSKDLMLMSVLTRMMMEHGIVDPDAKEITTNTVAGDTETIIIPHNMSKLQASKELERQHKEEETIIDLVHQYEVWDGKDALVAVMKTIQKTFGWIHGQPIMSMFGPINPREIQIVVDIKDGKEVHENCFVGDFCVTAWDNAKGSVGMGPGGTYVKFALKKKHKERAHKFFADVEQQLKTASIYKGKSIILDENGFAFVENKGSKDIILNDAEELVIKNLIIAPLAKDGKRCILFTGPYGTGKTETAMRIGREANSRGITFIYCKDSDQFSNLLDTAKLYQPAVVFMEDIDEIGSGEERDSDMNEILNTLDGVQTKGNDITVIFTTNHENRINKALRRPGRIDIILKFNKLEKSAVKKVYDRLLFDVPGYNNIDTEGLSYKTPEVQGAVIAEICKRAKRMAECTEDGQLTDTIVETAIESMKSQIAFMNGESENIIDPRIAAFETISKEISKTLGESPLAKNVKNICYAVGTSAEKE